MADITRLDRIGLPVWQAIRPASKALCVHQGKGASIADAQLGALLEAVESHAAENFVAAGVSASWQSLNSNQRPAQIADFARDRHNAPDVGTETVWIEAERADGGILMVPEPCVSLDFTRDKSSRFERVSAGLSTGSTLADARRAALLELIERDAVNRFDQGDYFARLACELDEGTVSFDWLADLRERLGSLGIDLRLFAAPSPTGVPVFIAAVSEDAKVARPYAGTVGHAAHPDPEIALFQAVAEAIQSRLTYIAGSRDDCWPWDYEGRRGITMALAPPPAVGIDQVDFSQITPVDSGSNDLVARLYQTGVKETAFLTIAQPESFFVVRAFAPGLGSLERAPRS